MKNGGGSNSPSDGLLRDSLAAGDCAGDGGLLGWAADNGFWSISSSEDLARDGLLLGLGVENGLWSIANLFSSLLFLTCSVFSSHLRFASLIASNNGLISSSSWLLNSISRSVTSLSRPTHESSTSGLISIFFGQIYLLILKL